MVDADTGALAVRIARETVNRSSEATSRTDPASWFSRRELPPIFDTHRGVFVTLRKYPSGQLRGCIGFPLPVLPLRIALPRAAASAALEDPRFPPLAHPETAGVVVEVSLLTEPERLPSVPPRERVHEVRVGRDGLIVRARGQDGLLLPQVAVEEHWGPEEFLDETCGKAGLPHDAWLWPETEIYRFASEVFAETQPSGPIRAIAHEPTRGGTVRERGR
jgi:uncharacterized protein